ncbi:MAG: lipoyl synthase [Euryarchaeota archaeon]|jgi:lipoic acid synthetase|nr:lipoyl synthase [Euryarchaeota archaeon]MBT4925049.1 lipoyl synthase [Euryarchaeota archaeon]MBT5735532.1 lipoyl synthase [Euryarchaeota archaeon]MBT7460361.1 lipoyl synthase [Euryarchaeota archaeon]
MSGKQLPMAGNKADSKKRKRLPSWFKTTLPSGSQQEIFNETKAAVKNNKLHTVCEEARCPNIHDCWSSGDATFMIAGQECTRGCRFCAVGSIKTPPPLDVQEPENLADAVESMNLRHVVITVVNRDDLEDSGSSHYKKCIEAVHKRQPDLTLELLCSDLAGDVGDLENLLIDSPLSVFAHNVECVPRLDRTVRDHRASFSQSLKILEQAKKIRPDIITKTSLMVGVGETDEEIIEAMKIIRSADVDLLTIGQYLAPSSKHLAIDRFPEPELYDQWAEIAIELGFLGVASGPFVRSSFKAGLLLRKLKDPENDENMPGAHVLISEDLNFDRHHLRYQRTEVKQ